MALSKKYEAHKELSEFLQVKPLQTEFRGGEDLGAKGKGVPEEQKTDDDTIYVDVDNDKRMAKISAELCSPYFSREVCLVSKGTTDKERVSRFIFSASQPVKVVYFKSPHVDLDLLALESLYHNIPIASTIIDVWSQILNYEEKKRDPVKNFARVFCDTQTLTYELTDGGRDQTSTAASFEKSIKLSMLRARHESERSEFGIFF